MALTNCTNLVRERKNRNRTCYPQRTSKPAAILASSLSTDLEISLQTVQEEGRKSHWVLKLSHTTSNRNPVSSTVVSLLALESPLDSNLAWLALLHRTCVLDQRLALLPAAAEGRQTPWSLLRIHLRKNLVLWTKSFLLHTVYRKFWNRWKM